MKYVMPAEDSEDDIVHQISEGAEQIREGLRYTLNVLEKYYAYIKKQAMSIVPGE